MLTFTPNILNKPVFKANNSFAYSSNASDITGRKVLNLANDVFEKKEIKEKKEKLIDKNIPKIDRYINAGRLFGSDTEIEINTESGILDKITNPEKASIFIMNHDNQKKDPMLLLIFNTLLMEEYKNKGNDYIEPKIIMNENILKSMNSKNREIFEELGATGIDAGCNNKNSMHNARVLASIMKDFSEDKANIFIFPEGTMSAYKSKPIEEKFQNGVANMVIKKLNTGKEVQVVPLGFSYPDNKKLAGIYMGNPITFRTNKDGVVECTQGNILSSKYGNDAYKKYYEHYKDKEYTPILNHGEKIEKKALIPYISGILCENLKICKAESDDYVKNSENNNQQTVLV